MKKLLAGLLAVFAFVSVPQAASAQNLVANGGFETGDFTDWTLENDSVFTGVTGTFEGVAPAEGQFQAIFGTVGSNTVLSQNLSTTLGQSYTISFSLANLSANPPYFFSAAFGLQPLGAPIAAVLLPGTAFPYTQFTYTGIATGATTELSFTFRHDPSYFLIDDISVTADAVGGAVPEPATWAMLILGFGLIGGAVRRRPGARVALAA